MSSSSSSQPDQDPKSKALNGYRRRLLEHRELDAKLKESTSLALLKHVKWIKSKGWQFLWQ